MTVPPGGGCSWSTSLPAQVPLFLTANVDGKRTVTGIEPVFNSRINPGNSFLVIIEASWCKLPPVCCVFWWDHHTAAGH
jgi:hypothetical protein